MTRKTVLIVVALAAVAGLAWFLWRKGFLMKAVVTPPAVGVRSAVGSNFFSVADRSLGNIMANLNAPVSSPVSAGPRPVTVPLPPGAGQKFGRTSLVAQGN